MTTEPISRFLDPAVLMPDTTRDEAIQAIKACIGFNTRTVCVRPCDIVLAKELCKGTDTGVCVVLGFPHGVALSASKADEARRYVELGVGEIDMVANYGLAKSGLWAEVLADVQAVAAVTKPAGVPLKVIFETSQLDVPAIKKLVDICVEAGADFVKTSTGFTGGGATDEAVSAMVEAAAGRIKIKPSGGVRDRARAELLLGLGVHRLGVNWTSCQAICEGETAESSASSSSY